MKVKQGFTLVELLVVIAMLMILIASMTSAVNKARVRAKIARATQEVKEMTNAILAFEHYAKDHTLENYVTGGWVPCSESAMRIIFGGETGDNGENVPVLYNGRVGAGGELRDPWGTAYQYVIERTSKIDGGEGSGADDVKNLVSAPALPNFNRISAEERGL